MIVSGLLRREERVGCLLLKRVPKAFLVGLLEDSITLLAMDFTVLNSRNQYGDNTLENILLDPDTDWVFLSATESSAFWSSILDPRRDRRLLAIVQVCAGFSR